MDYSFRIIFERCHLLFNKLFKGQKKLVLLLMEIKTAVTSLWESFWSTAADYVRK